jgi:hypothetical protein
MKAHLKHMAEVRPRGLDRDAVRWALAEIERLETLLRYRDDLAVMAGEKILTAWCARAGIELMEAEMEEWREREAACGQGSPA